MTRPSRRPPRVEVIVGTLSVVTIVISAVTYIYMAASIDHAKRPVETIYCLRDGGEIYPRAVRMAHVRAPNERAARMRIALYEHDSKWEDGTKTSCVPALHDPADMMIERAP
jgi:hypothetical protein